MIIEEWLVAEWHPSDVIYDGKNVKNNREFIFKAKGTWY
jgi:hypothetical protein